MSEVHVKSPPSPVLSTSPTSRLGRLGPVASAFLLSCISGILRSMFSSLSPFSSSSPVSCHPAPVGSSVDLASHGFSSSSSSCPLHSLPPRAPSTSRPLQIRFLAFPFSLSSRAFAKDCSIKAPVPGLSRNLLRSCVGFREAILTPACLVWFLGPCLFRSSAQSGPPLLHFMTVAAMMFAGLSICLRTPLRRPH